MISRTATSLLASGQLGGKTHAPHSFAAWAPLYTGVAGRGNPAKTSRPPVEI